MTAMTVTVTDDGVRIGEPPTDPARAGVVEARGGLLFFDELSDSDHPAAVVHEPEQAADWLWDVYGHAAAAAVLAGEPLIEPDGASATLTAVRTLAHLNWARAWWPASAIAGVPRLEAALLRAEIAVSVAAVEQLLDDDEAVARALSEVDLERLRDRPESAPLPDETAALAERIAELAEDYGVTPATAADTAEAATQWTLAAGGETASGGIGLRTGTSGIDWTLLRPGRLDAAAGVEWSIVRERGQSRLTVSVPAAPGPWRDLGELRARLGEDEVTLGRPSGATAYSGSGPVSMAVLRLPEPRRQVVVYSPELVPSSTVEAPEPAVLRRQSALIARSRARVGSTAATLTERVAARAAP